jgi:hypothetical protein
MGVQVRQSRSAWQQYGMFAGATNPPGVCTVVTRGLEGNGTGPYGGTGWANVIIEKPIVDQLSLITVGEESLPRLLAGGTVGMTSGVLRLSYFTGAQERARLDIAVHSGHHSRRCYANDRALRPVDGRGERRSDAHRVHT